MAEYSKYQKKVISNYYENKDTIKATQLQETVTELYLADSEKKTNKLWQKAEDTMRALEFKDSVIENVMRKRDVVILAKVVNDLVK
jgi:hypothetical protein